MNLPPDLYYPCLYSTEQAACRLAYASVVPPYVFVIPCAPIDAHFAASPVNFDGRQEAWVNMFGFVRTEIEVVPTVFVDVYLDPYGMLQDWLLYEPINGGVDDTHCRQNEYTPI